MRARITDGQIKRRMARVFVDQLASGQIKKRNMDLAADVLRSSLSDRPGLQQVCIRAVELSQGVTKKRQQCKRTL